MGVNHLGHTVIITSEDNLDIRYVPFCYTLLYILRCLFYAVPHYRFIFICRSLSVDWKDYI